MRRHLNYANVVATLALVFAMSGGAMAANHYLITSTKQISPKVLQEAQGQRGQDRHDRRSGSAGATGLTSNGPHGKEGSSGNRSCRIR